MNVVESLASLRSRIAAAGGGPGVRVVGVTKGQAPQVIAEAAAAGVEDLGENYSQELLAKHAWAEEHGIVGLRWHFLGALQRNKVAALGPLVWLWQSVDRPEEATSIARVAPGARVLVQVGIAPGPGRAGCDPEQTGALVGHCRQSGLQVLGLMAVGAPEDPEATRAGFRWLAGEAAALDLAEVSMGMSDDLEVAVEEGSTMVRIGRALFGPRPGPASLRR
jgi:pyridoxal phosphate enzyme (YggS family)